MTIDKILEVSTSIIGNFLIIFSVLVFFNPQKINKKANFFFGLFTVGLASHFVSEIFIIHKIPLNYYIDILLIFLQLYVTFFFYCGVKYLTNPIFSLHKNIKFFVVFVFLFIIGIILTSSNKIEIENPNNFNVFFEIIYLVNLVLYAVLSYKTVKKHNQEILKYNANTEKSNLKWVFTICYILFIILAIFAFEISFFHYNNKVNLSLYLLPFYFVGILFISFHIMKQKEIYTLKEAITYELNEVNENVIKKEIIEQDKLPEFKNLITNLFEKQKPYLDSELNLIKTAEILNLTTHQVSFILNEGFKENFSQFVNRYRIEEAKKLIVNPNMNHLSILGIGFEVGFNSKTVFNTTFKKNTGYTPTEYKKSEIAA